MDPTHSRKKAPEDPILLALEAASADETKAVELFEVSRWADAPTCPLCGSADVYRMRSDDGGRERNYRWRCRKCGDRYTVRTGTVFAETRIPMHKWAHTYWRAVASKKGVSALQIKREVRVSYKTALFMMHRIRYAMETDWGTAPKMTGTVEVDETFAGGKPRFGSGIDGRKTRASRKTRIAALVERGGRLRLERIVAPKKHKELERIVLETIDTNSRLMTDEAPNLQTIGNHFGQRHFWTTHSHGQYAKPGGIHSNTAECAFSLLKRALVGTWHSVSKTHLHRYLSEMEFRWNTRYGTDGDRFVAAIRASEGRRLQYEAPVA